MKDQKDTTTADLLRKPGAKRQAALKARREAEGYKRTTVWVKQADYDAGVNAAQLGSGTIRDYPDGCDVFSWMLGYSTEIARFENIMRESRRDQQ